jgi:sugar phosphate permease
VKTQQTILTHTLSPASPGCLYYLSCWYTRKELGFRTAVLYSGALISGAFSGLISAGVTWGMDGTRGLGAWQWLFIIEGAATVVVACICAFVLPNFPRTTTWLTDEERTLAVW